MKRCPTCNRTFTDENLSFCIDDGTPLAPVGVETQTGSSAGSGRNEPPRTESYGPSEWTGPAYTPPSHVPLGSGEKRKVWPWVVGILAILFMAIIGLGIAGAVLVPRWIERTADKNTPPPPSNVNEEQQSQVENTNTETNANVPSETPEIPNTNEDLDEEDSGLPPADEAQVLSQLKELEHEWTVANINADKKALARILADDYVGVVENGKPQGKAEYIRTIERDTMIESWEFQDLKISLKGDRATLDGVLKLRIQSQELLYRFTDKFVWREGRWQAISSEVAQLR